MIVQTKKSDLLSLSGNEKKLDGMAKLLGVTKKVGKWYKMNPKKHRSKALKVGIPLMRVQDLYGSLKKAGV